MTDERERTKDDHCTPPEVLEVVRAFAPVALDPCSNRWSLGFAEHSLDLDRGECGLATPWRPLVRPGALAFVNPPFRHGEQIRWVRKCAAEGVEGVESVLLLPATLASAQAKLAWRTADALAAWGRRIQFLGARRSGNPHGSAFWYFGDRPEAFLETFRPRCTFAVLTDAGRAREGERRAA